MTQVIPRELDDALGFNLYRVALLFRRELMRALERYLLTPEQWQVLVALVQGAGSLEQHELAELTLRDKHTLSRIVARMERDGWIARRPHSRDRRVTLVQPSRRARAEMDSVRKHLFEHFTPILAQLSRAEHAGLMASLKKLRGYLERAPVVADEAGSVPGSQKNKRTRR